MVPATARLLPVIAATALLQSCFYPPMVKPPAAEKNQAVLSIPYDLAWDATMAVIKNNDYRVQAQDPTHGIIEAQTHRFSLQEADCGHIGSLGGRFSSEPQPGSSAVYNFYLKASGPESTTVAVQATFNTPLSVPFHPVRDFECVSRGVQEARLLKELQTQASKTHRPAYKKAAN